MQFARGKLGGDPVFEYLLASGLLNNRARMLDIGCGQGLLASWLLTAQTLAVSGSWPSDWPCAPAPSHIQGIEVMEQDVARAKSALTAAIASGHAGVELADMRNADFNTVDVAVLLDVLHYIPWAEQEVVLQRVRNALAPGGMLLLRVADANAGLPFVFSAWVDKLVAMLRGLPVKQLYHRPYSAWQTLLRTLGFTVASRAMSQGTPFANFLLVARLPNAQRIPSPTSDGLEQT